MTVAAAAPASVVVLVVRSPFPDVMPSSTGPAGTLTLRNASSSHDTLVVMTWVAVALVPVVLAYQAWSLWVFRRQISAEHVTVFRCRRGGSTGALLPAGQAAGSQRGPGRVRGGPRTRPSPRPSSVACLATTARGPRSPGVGTKVPSRVRPGPPRPLTRACAGPAATGPQETPP